VLPVHISVLILQNALSNQELKSLSILGVISLKENPNMHVLSLTDKEILEIAVGSSKLLPYKEKYYPMFHQEGDNIYQLYDRDMDTDVSKEVLEFAKLIIALNSSKESKSSIDKLIEAELNAHEERQLRKRGKES
jgi:hypothetical protein